MRYSNIGFPDTGFQIMSTIIPIFFVVVLGLIFFTIVKGILQWNSNNQQPVLSVWAKITSKRANTSHSSTNMNDNMSSTTSTSYYVTFEVESGDRIELHIASHEYGLLAEGDVGKLTFQGTRYLGFERERV